MIYSGVWVSLFLIVLNGVIAWYIGMLIVPCVEKTGGSRYEDFARVAFGRLMEKLTSMIICLCGLGFVISFMILLQTLIPHLITVILYGEIPLHNPDPLPDLIGKGKWSG